MEATGIMNMEPQSGLRQPRLAATRQRSASQSASEALRYRVAAKRGSRNRFPLKQRADVSLTPAPGTPGEGWAVLKVPNNPLPNPPPEYREREDG